ncbi:SWIM zinc finger family protein [Bhargavaea cecembensis]|uniref:SWIM zinc finger family protein n=1 Tax=Bhargavaea cecembensis TaxID=394098 RepID=UPI0005911415|nr:hypothetical protein [Bhargavaea cecembensis]
MNLSRFESTVNDKILRRGRNYHRDGHVSEILLQGDGKYTLTVDGTRRYFVTVNISPDGEILASGCTCPYDMGPVCKHEVAAYFELRETNAQKENAGIPPAKPSGIPDILGRLSKEELVSVLAEWAGRDEELARMLEMRYAESGPDEVLSQFQDAIREVVDRHSDRSGYIGYEASFGFGNELGLLLDEAESAEDPLTGLDMAWMVLSTAVDAFGYTDDSAGSVGGAVDLALVMINDTVDDFSQNTLELKEKMADRLLEWSRDPLLEEWTDFRDRLLGTALILADEKEIRKKIGRRLDELIRHEEDEFGLGDPILLKLDLLNRSGDEAAAAALIEEHLPIEAVRTVAIEDARISGDFERIIRLALEGEELAREQSLPGSVKKWQEHRLQAYRELGMEAQAEMLAWSLLMDGDIRLYNDFLKDLHSGSPDFYEEVKHGLKTGGRRAEKAYMTLIEQERDLPELLDAVRTNPGTIEHYAELLIEEYPGEVISIYSAEILGGAPHSNNRGAYRRLCEELDRFGKTVGRGHQLTVMNKLRKDYPRRRAMLEELDRLEIRI